MTPTNAPGGEQGSLDEEVKAPDADLPELTQVERLRRLGLTEREAEAIESQAAPEQSQDEGEQ